LPAGPSRRPAAAFRADLQARVSDHIDIFRLSSTFVLAPAERLTTSLNHQFTIIVLFLFDH